MCFCPCRLHWGRVWHTSCSHSCWSRRWGSRDWSLGCSVPPIAACSTQKSSRTAFHHKSSIPASLFAVPVQQELHPLKRNCGLLTTYLHISIFVSIYTRSKIEYSKYNVYTITKELQSKVLYTKWRKVLLLNSVQECTCTSSHSI